MKRLFYAANEKTARRERILLPFLLMVVATVACWCGGRPAEERCVNPFPPLNFFPGDMSHEFYECTRFIEERCGAYPVLPASSNILYCYEVTPTAQPTEDQLCQAFEQCQDTAFDQFFVYRATVTAEFHVTETARAEPLRILPSATPPRAPAVPDVSQPQVLTASCSAFRLTSPLLGLANGNQTFYWDPLPVATGYRVQILENGAVLATFETGADQTNLTADVSADKIGGLFTFVVRVQALNGAKAVCSDEREMLREASGGGGDNGVSEPVVAPPSLCGNGVCDSSENGAACPKDCFCGNFTCDAGEDAFNCGQDCGG